jgi:alkanesulfonate monooxygenase
MVSLHWYLPTSGDGRHVGAVTAVQARTLRSTARDADLGYLTQIALAAERAGFEAVRAPTGAACHDAWLVCAALAAQTTRLEFLVSFRPGFVLPTLAAKQAATFQQLSGNRLRAHVVIGGDPVEQRAYGDLLDHDQRYARGDEFLTVFARALHGEPFDFDGEYYTVERGGVLEQVPMPAVYFGGASPAAERVAARHADVHLMWGEPPDAIAQRIARVRDRADAAGRDVRFGLRVHVISRDSTAQAWREAQRLLDGMAPEAVQASLARFARMDSVGQARMAALSARDDLEVSPNLWAGIGLVREGAATALVGSHDDVAERIEEYRDLGVDEFVLSGYPHLEEAFRFGECVRPLLRERTPPIALVR